MDVNNWWIDHMNYRNGSFIMWYIILIINLFSNFRNGFYIMSYITSIIKYVPEQQEWLLHNVLYHIDHKSVAAVHECFLHHVLYHIDHKAKTISWIAMVLPHRKNMKPHPDTLCSFRAKQCLLVHLNLAFLAKKQHIRMCLVFGFTRVLLEPTTYLTRNDHTSHYTPDVVYFL